MERMKKAKKSKRKRLSEIIRVLSKHKIAKGLNPIKFREMIEDLGPTFIKLGQIMSMRTDILPEEYCEELTKLRKEVSPMPFSSVQSILEAEWNVPLTEVLLDIQEIPIGSASIAQVHLAKLKSGQKVVLKIQREEIYEKMEADIALMKMACSILHVPAINQVVDLKGILDEIWKAAVEELNFLSEASHMNQFRQNSQAFHYIKVPELYEKYTTKRVLMMEYIEGITLDHFQQLKQQEYDLNEIANKLANHYIYQIVEDGYFHADPHPDNIKIADGKIVYLDFGMMGRLNQHDRILLKDCMKAILKNDIHEVVRIFLEIGIQKKKIEYTNLYKDMERLINRYASLELSEMDLAEVLMDVFKVATTHQIAMPTNITMLMRGIMIIESDLYQLSPSTNLMEVLKNHLAQQEYDSLFQKGLKKNLLRLGALQNGILDIPPEVLSLLKMVVRGDAKVNLELTDSQNKIGKLDKILHRMIICILDAAFILGTALCINNAGPKLFNMNVIGILFFVISIVLTTWLFYQMYKDKRK